MRIKNDINLIGDLLATVPVMQALADKHGGLEVYQTLDEGKWVYPMIKGVTLTNNQHCDMELDISEAFEFGGRNELYMTSCYHHQVGLQTPKEPPRPQLDVPEINVPNYDYLFAPFSRSSPEEQKWKIEKWSELGLELELLGYKVAVLGNSKYNGPIPDLNNEFDRPMIEVLNLIRRCTRGVVSVNTGISHLCFAMEAKNYLLNNQGQGWAVHPEAISIETYIPRITVDEMLEFILCH